MLKKTSSCSANTFSLLKYCKELLQMYFLFLFFVLWNLNLSAFDVHIMWLAFNDYRQQIHWNFKFLIWNVDWKGWFIFISKHIGANVIFHFNFTKIFFWYMKFNFSVIKTIIFTAKICLTWCQRKHFWSSCLMLIRPLFGLLNSAGNFK